MEKSLRPVGVPDASITLVMTTFCTGIPPAAEATACLNEEDTPSWANWTMDMLSTTTAWTILV